MTRDHQLRALGRAAARAVFYGWNTMFLMVLGFGLGPLVLAPLVVACVLGIIPPPFALVALAIAVTPPLATFVGAWKLNADPGRLLSFFYGVEAPFLALCLVRLFGIGQLTAPTALLLGAWLVGVAGLTRTLLHGPTEGSAVAQGARVVAASAGLVVGSWGVVLLSIYVPPLVVGGGYLLVEVFRSDPNAFLGASTFLVFLAATLVALTVFPVALFGLSMRHVQLVVHAARVRFGWPLTLGLAGATIGGLLGGFAWTSAQPQGPWFDRIEAVRTDRDRRALMDDEPALRSALVAIATSETTLLQADGNHVRNLWGSTIHAAAGQVAAELWTGVTWPFAFHPSGSDLARGGETDRWLDAWTARRVYASLLDTPIDVGDRDAMLAAAQATWSPHQAHAGLLTIGDRKVRLARQELTVAPDGDLATVRIHDVYRNQTFEPQEVSVSFSLPESAAITGLWLSTQPDFDRADRYVVATRGAAQAVYERSVENRVDPALVEQVGPHHYRLRAFPVVARDARLTGPLSGWEVDGDGDELHLWLEYVVLADTSGAPCWPTPVVAETRNLGVDAELRTLDGSPFTADGWMPECLPAPGVVARPHRALVGGHVIEALPAHPVEPARLGHVAVVIDGSRSMVRHADEVAEALAALRAAATQVDVWCVREDALVPCPTFEPATALWFGDAPSEDRLVAAAAATPAVDRLVVLTDAGAYEAATRRTWPDLALPETWFVHLGGWPAAWADWTLDHVGRSGGGFVDSVDALALRLADREQADGRTFRDLPATDAPPLEPAFTPIAARRRIRDLDREQRSGTLGALDALHALAVEYHVVTPWSSMLVVVTDDQRDALAEAEGKADRFEREGIDDDLPPPSAAPEPATTALLLLAALGVGAAHRTRRARAAGNGT